MLRKTLALSLALCLILALPACGSPPAPSSPSESSSSSTQESGSAPESSSLPDAPASREESSSAPEVPALIAVTGLTWNKSVDLTLTVGTLNRRTVTVSPDDAADKSVTYSSSNPAAATVDASGLVVCVAPGETVITATADSAPEVTVSYTITVAPKPDPPADSGELSSDNGGTASDSNWVKNQESRKRVIDAAWAYAKTKGLVKFEGSGRTTFSRAERSADSSEAQIIQVLKGHIDECAQVGKKEILIFASEILELKYFDNDYVGQYYFQVVAFG